jgi:O-antigen/teichoic acid export membrane protein
MLKDLGKSVFIYGIASGMSKFVGLFLIPFFSRCFSPEQYGSLDLIATVISFVSIFGMLQLESAISRYYYEVEGTKRKIYISTAFWTIFAFSSLLQLIILFSSDSISILLFKSLNYTNIIKVASFNILLLNLFGFLTVLLRFNNKPLFYSLVIFTQFILTGIVSVILVLYFNFGIMAFFLGQAIGLLFASAIVILNLKDSFVFVFNLKVLKDFFYYSIPQVPAVAGNWMNSYANRFIMLGSLSIRDIGIYTVALKIASIFNLFENAFRMAWEPYLWKKIKQPNHREIIVNLAKFISIAVFSAALLLILFSKELIFILSTREYSDALPLIKILIFAFSFPILAQVFGIGTSIVKKTIYNTIGFFIGIFVNILLLFLLIPNLGLIGVPLSLAASNFTILILMCFFSERLYFIGFKFKKIILLVGMFTLIASFLLFYELNLIYKVALILVLFLTLIGYNKKLILLYLDRTIAKKGTLGSV